MNKKTALGAMSISCLAAITLTLGIVSFKHNKGFDARLEAGAYTLTLNNSNGITGTNVTTTHNVTTDSGSREVPFNYEKCSALNNGHATILATGKIVNHDHIRSIYSLTATFTTEGALKFRTSYDGATWGGYTTMVSTENYPLGSNPYFVEFSTDGTHSVDVTSIRFSYSCLENAAAHEGAEPEDPVYTKVTNDAGLENGQYLIVYETGGKAFDSSKSSLNATGNYISVSISNNTIAHSNETANAEWTLIKNNTKWNIKSSDGETYIGRSENSNGMNISSSALDNSISVSSGVATIAGSAGPTLQFNNNNTGDLFRYYKSSQQSVALYKLTGGAISYDTPVDENGFIASDSNKDNYNTKSIFDTANGLMVKATKTDGTQTVLSKGGENGYSYVVKNSASQAIDTSKAFPAAGAYTLEVYYKDYLPAIINLTVGEHLTGIAPQLTTSAFTTADTMSEHLTNNLTAHLTYSGGSSEDVTYANFASKNLQATLLDPNDVVKSMSSVFGVAGTWKIKVTSTVDNSIYGIADITVSAIQVQSISFESSAMVMHVGDIAELIPVFTPANATDKSVNWTSSDDEVVEVDDGTVTALKVGTATITATTVDGGKTATCDITVKKVATQTATIACNFSGSVNTSTNISSSLDEGDFTTEHITLTGVSGSGFIACDVAKTQYRLGSGSNTGSITFEFDACVVTGVSFEAASYNTDSNVQVRVKTSANTTGQTVTLSGSSKDTYSTTAFKDDTAQSTSVTIQTVSSGKRAHFFTLTLTVGVVDPVYPTAIGLSNATVNVGETTTLVPTFTPVDTNQKDLVWHSSNTSVATVTSEGVVTGVSAGKSTITATGKDENDDDVVGTCEVTVKTVAVTSVSFDSDSYSVTVGKTTTVSSTVLPANATNKAVSYSSNNTSVATVNSNGVVSGVSAGTATITVTTADGGKTDTCTVTVTNKVIDKWTIMIYMCGSNLESGYGYDDYDPNDPLGYASSDIAEILSVNNQPSDVNIIIETGGARNWKNTTIRPYKDVLARWEVKNKQLVYKDEADKASMGKTSTLQDFLEWGLTNYEAQNYGLIMWNHGGALDGCCFDENFSNDSITADEMNTAVSNARSNNSVTNKFEFITYDACLMAVQEIAEMNRDNFKYMLSSQETESGSGYDYDAWLPTLYNNTSVSTQTILTQIATTFIAEQTSNANSYNNYYHYTSSDEDYWPYDQTQSVFDLTKMGAYKTAFESFASGLAGIVNSTTKWNSFRSLVLSSSVKSYGDGDYDIFNVAGEKGLLTALKNNSTYSSLSSQIAAVEAALEDVVVYEEHQKETYGCGMCVEVPVSSKTYKSDYTAQCRFTNWYNFVTTKNYGSFR